MGIYAALARGTFLDPLIIGGWLLLDAIPTIVLIPVVTWFFALKLGVVLRRSTPSPNALATFAASAAYVVAFTAPRLDRLS